MDEIMGSGAPIRLEDYIADLRTKLAAAEAKSEQRREVLREREFNNEETTNYGCHQEWFCGDCGARARIRFEGDKWAHEPHKEFCAWKRAMED